MTKLGSNHVVGILFELCLIRSCKQELICFPAFLRFNFAIGKNTINSDYLISTLYEYPDSRIASSDIQTGVYVKWERPVTNHSAFFPVGASASITSRETETGINKDRNRSRGKNRTLAISLYTSRSQHDINTKFHLGNGLYVTRNYMPLDRVYPCICNKRESKTGVLEFIKRDKSVTCQRT